MSLDLHIALYYYAIRWFMEALGFCGFCFRCGLPLLVVGDSSLGSTSCKFG
jgi:hypothetical protein